MKLFSCYTPSHETLAREWFEPSLQGDYDELVMPRTEAADWLEGIRFKIGTILSAMGNGPFVWADCDSQFFGPTHDDLLHRLNGYDIVFSRDDQAGRFNSGIFVCSGSDRMKTLWEAVREHCRKHSQNDQEALMHKLRGHDKLEGMRWSAGLPDSYYCSGIETSRPWRPGVTLNIPREQKLLVHHAAWARSIEDKIAQLQYVRNLQKAR